MIEGTINYGWEPQAVCLPEGSIDHKMKKTLEAEDKKIEAEQAVRNCEEGRRK